MLETRTRLYYSPSPGKSRDRSQDYLIFHIPGNPGLIPYYDPFLSTLHKLLSAFASTNFYICGYSLSGFETAELHDSGTARLTGLRGQITHIEERLYAEVNKHRQNFGRTPKVILMGHSVGAYILLELIRNHRKMIESGEKDFDLIGGILLFPTITDIAKSPSGIVASKLLAIPQFAHIASALVKPLMYLVPTSLLYYLVRAITWFPEHAARTTTAFIKSRNGVKEALYLAKDEMDMITDDKWGEEIWGAATETGTNSQDTVNSNLYFFWGQNDRWVADRTRNDLIAARGYLDRKQANVDSEDWKPVMCIDDRRIPHGFCIKHSELMANKVGEWVDEIICNHNDI